ncbi:restriction endonuclease subunit S [Corallococcus coralloides]|uniref:restriction endonuclease subunit S n=1 Tax=Corallococcus coralloides TaxID=184914 RepID=UPI003851669B
MSPWVEVSVEDLVSKRLLQVGDGYRVTNAELGPAGIPFVRGGDIGNNGNVDTAPLDRIVNGNAPQVRVKHSRPEDVVFITKGTVGRVGYLRPPQPTVVFAPQVAVWRSLDHSRLVPRFLYYLLKSARFQAQLDGVKTHGSMAADYVSISDQMHFKLPLPPPVVQGQIAASLGALDDKIDLNRRMNQTLEAMAQALFRSWFVDFDPVRAKAEGRQPEGMDAETAALFPSRLVDSGLGEIPEAWQIASLGGLVDELETGSRPKGGVAGIVEGVPSVGAESVTRIGEYDYGKVKRVPRAFFEGMRKGKLRSWDVLLYKDGGRPGEFEPKASLVGEGFPFEEMAINEHVYRLRADHHLTQSFLYLLLSSETVKEELRRRGTGVAVPGLNSTALRTMPVLRPTGPVLRAFDSTASVLLRKILVTSKESRDLATVRDLLLPKLLSGEIRVGDAEVQLAASA